MPNHRPVPELAYWTGTRPADIVPAQLEQPTLGGVFIEPASEEVAELSILDKRDPRRLDARRPGGFREVARNRSWVLSAGAGCRG